MLFRKGSTTNTIIVSVVAVFAVLFMFNYTGTSVDNDAGFDDVTGNFLKTIGGKKYYWEAHNWGFSVFASSKLEGNGESIKLPPSNNYWHRKLKNNKDHVLAFPSESNLASKYDGGWRNTCKSSYGLSKKSNKYCKWTPTANDRTSKVKTVARYVKMTLPRVPGVINRESKYQRHPSYVEITFKRLMGPKNYGVGMHIFTAPSGGSDGVGKWKWKKWCVLKKNTDEKKCRIKTDSNTRWIIVARSSGGGRTEVPYIYSVVPLYKER